MTNDHSAFIKTLADIEGSIVSSDMDTKTQEIEKYIKELIRAVKIDWREMKDQIEIWETISEVPQYSYEEIFINYWLDKIPLRTHDLLLEIIRERKKNDPIFQDSVGAKILEKVKLLGASIYQIRNTSLCASTVIPPIPCEKCYFVEICKIKS